MKLFRASNGRRTWLIRQIVACLCCSIIYIVNGNSLNWMEPYSNVFMLADGDYSMSLATYSLLSSLTEISNVIAAIPCGYAADRWGRKIVLLTTGPMYLFSWTLLEFTRNINVLFIARILQGITQALAFIAGPAYLAEIASPNIRGALAGSLTLFFYLGILYTYLLSNLFSYQGFLYMSMIAPCVFFIGFIFIPESPYYYLMKNNITDAKKSLSWFRASDEVSEELREIEESVRADMNRKGGFRDLIATKADRRALLIVQIVAASAFLSCLMPIFLYTKYIFNTVPDFLFNAEQLTLVFGIVLTLSCLAGMFLSDTVGRRKLLIISSSGSTVCLIILCIYCFLHEMTSVDVASYVWMFYTVLFIYCFLYNSGSMQIIRAVQGEFFPSHTRSAGCALVSLASSIEISISFLIFLPIIDSFGLYMNFLIYALVNFIITILIIIFVTESAGKTLQEINEDMME